MSQVVVNGSTYYVVSGIVYTTREEALEALRDERDA